MTWTMSHRTFTDVSSKSDYCLWDKQRITLLLWCESDIYWRKQQIRLLLLVTWTMNQTFICGVNRTFPDVNSESDYCLCGTNNEHCGVNSESDSYLLILWVRAFLFANMTELCVRSHGRTSTYCSAVLVYTSARIRVLSGPASFNYNVVTGTRNVWGSWRCSRSLQSLLYAYAMACPTPALSCRHTLTLCFFILFSLNSYIGIFLFTFFLCVWEEEG